MTKLIIELELDDDDSDSARADAYDVVNDVLDNGLLQDNVNECSAARVLSVVVRRPPCASCSRKSEDELASLEYDRQEERGLDRARGLDD